MASSRTVRSPRKTRKTPEPCRDLIFDTVALVNFLLSGSENILIDRYKGRGLVSVEVYEELLAGVSNGRISQGGLDRLMGKGGFQVITMKHGEFEEYKRLIRSLGRGEASCVSLAGSRGAVVVTDDRLARKVCQERGIAFTGTIGILKAAVERSWLSPSEADAILGKMIKAGFYSPVNSISGLC